VPSYFLILSSVSFIFIALAFILLPLGELSGVHFSTLETIFCAVLIGTFGISHGAIDHYMYGVKTKKENTKFISIYVLAACSFGVMWLINPDLAFLIFLLISAYHFGQSQFVSYSQKIRWPDQLFYLIWGSWLLSVYLYLNSQEILNSYQASLLKIDLIPILIGHTNILIITLSGALGLLFAIQYSKKRLNLQQLFFEFYQLILIVIVFRISSPLLGFTLYFVILHSMRVMQHEYSFLHRKVPNFTTRSFVKILAPFTLISLAGLALLTILFFVFQIEISIPIIALIFISCLTFPHAFVMDLFYKNKMIS